MGLGLGLAGRERKRCNSLDVNYGVTPSGVRAQVVAVCSGVSVLLSHFLFSMLLSLFIYFFLPSPPRDHPSLHSDDDV